MTTQQIDPNDLAYFNERERRFDVRLKDLLAELQAEDLRDRDSSRIRDLFRRYGEFFEDEPQALEVPYRLRQKRVVVIDEESAGPGEETAIVAHFDSPREAGEWLKSHADPEKVARGGYGLDVQPDDQTEDNDRGCGYCGRDNRNGTHTALEMAGHLSHKFDPDAEPGPEHPDYKEPAPKTAKKTAAKKASPKK